MSSLAPEARTAFERDETRRLGAPFVLFTGGKGGVGKSTLAANLAVQLSRERKRVLLVDLDLGLANLNVILRLHPTHTLEDVADGRVAAEACLLEGPGGIHVLPASSGSPAMARSDGARRARLLRELDRLAADYDIVIGDTAAGIGPDVLAFAAVAHHVLAVTTPEPAAMTDAYGLVKALDAWAAERGVEVPTPEIVVNLTSGFDEAERTHARLRVVCERFLARSPRLAGWLPRSAAVLESALRQQPFVTIGSKSLQNNCLRRLSARVQRWFDSAGALACALKASDSHGR